MNVYRRTLGLGEMGEGVCVLAQRNVEAGAIVLQLVRAIVRRVFGLRDQ